ncbi:hypothetical protein ACHAW5_001638 [Stephanodiscus triporus]|uniref:Uncharacterized protein n=1 Tax=Stephanodiscus triporus TaxID=2934178 RepID=A0ABD3PZ88_9STRA
MMGPVAKCLETALDEMLAEDDQTNMGTRDDGGTGRRGTTRVDVSNNFTDTDEEISVKKRELPPAESIADGGRDCDGTIGANENNGRSFQESTSNLNVRLDEAISRSILESYRKAAVETKFDREREPVSASHSDLTTDAAPAAMLKGEIDHFNRIGGQWRIVVKNAVLKPRSLTTTDNGMSGRSCRKRTVLDWDDNNDDAQVGGCKKSASLDASDKVVFSEKVKNDSSGVHYFLGTIQILAYDDT